jgi:hypothetical protein
MGIEEQAGAIAVRTTDIHLPRADRCHAREPRIGRAASTSFMAVIRGGVAQNAPR